MALKFQPKEKTVVMCDFSGFKEPEMVKVRPVVVLAKHKHNGRLVTIVPLSTTEPFVAEKHHHQMSINPLPDKAHITCWAKCDMVYTVSIDRLDRYCIGRREYVTPSVPDDDFIAIKTAVACALRLESAPKNLP